RNHIPVINLVAQMRQAKTKVERQMAVHFPRVLHIGFHISEVCCASSALELFRVRAEHTKDRIAVRVVCIQRVGGISRENIATVEWSSGVASGKDALRNNARFQYMRSNRLRDVVANWNVQACIVDWRTLVQEQVGSVRN